MERNTQIWVGVVVLAGLAGGVYYKAKEDSKIGTSQTTSADLPDLKSPEDVDKIAITNGEKGDVVLEKKGDKWELTKPAQAPANQNNVKSLLDNLKELKAKEVIVSTPSDDQKKEFQFEPSKAVHVVTSKGGEKKLDVTFGKSGARGQLAMVEGKPAVYSVSGYSSYLYARETKGWRDGEILKFDDANATQLTIERKDGAFSFTKGGDKWAATYKGRPLERFDEERVKEALRALKSLNAEDFADGKTPAETGLAEPESRVTVQLKDDAAKYLLKVGSKVPGASTRYAQKEGDPTIYVLSQYPSDFVVPEVSKYQKDADAGAPPAAKKEPPK